jgi:hypothetical protein
MNGVAQLVEPHPMARFLLRWLVAAAMPVALAVSVTVGVIQIGIRYGLEAWISLSALGLLSYPVLQALAQGYIMRGFLRRAALWGVLSSGGFVAAMLAVFATALSFDALLWPLVSQFSIALRDVLGLAVPPGMLLKYSVSGLLFGTVLGGVQSLVLGPGWRARLEWIGVSAAAGVALLLWVYLWLETDLMNELPDDISGEDDVLILTAVTGWSVAAWMFYALPTGWFMQRLLRRRDRADAEALLRRFE